MKLLLQPGDGIQPTVKAINRAKSSVEIAIFRFDRGEVERALANAVSRGLFVHALIAYTNRGGKATCADSKCVCSGRVSLSRVRIPILRVTTISS